MRLVHNWRTYLKRSHSIRVQIVQAVFGLLSWFEPGAALAIWNQMPGSVAARAPAGFVERVGAVLFALALASIVFRLLRQPKLEAKIEEKQNGQAA
jgi:hypothetical protein